MSGSWLLLPLLLPLAAGIGLFFIQSMRARQVFTSVVLAEEIVLVIALGWNDVHPICLFRISQDLEITIGMDPLGRMFTVLICVIWLVVAVFAYEYMNHEYDRQRFFGFYMMTLSAMVGVCLASNLITLYLFYEMMTLLSLALVVHIGTRSAYDAGMRYLGFSVLGAGMALWGMFTLTDFCTTGVFTPGGVLDGVLAAQHRELLQVVLMVMLLGFGCKAGMFPLHAWLPTAHPVAPVPASAVLSGLITKMGVLAMVRVTYYIFGWNFVRGSWVQQGVLILSLITIFMGSALAMREDTLKKRLAYSTVSQVSYIIFGLMLLTPQAMYGALLQIIFHAVAKNGLFLCAGSIIYKTHLTQVSQLRGVGTSYPITMWSFALAALSLIGIPPTGGFVSKWFLAQGALGSGTGALGAAGVAVLMLSALMTAGYLLPIVQITFFPGNDFDRHSVVKQHASWMMSVPLVILAVATVVLGMFPKLLEPVLIDILDLHF